MWWHTVTHGRGSEGETGEWSGYPVPFTLPRNMAYPAILPMMRTLRLPVVNWTDAPADLNGLVSFAERRNLVSARAITFQAQSTPVLYKIGNKFLYTAWFNFSVTTVKLHGSIMGCAEKFVHGSVRLIVNEYGWKRSVYSFTLGPFIFRERASGTKVNSRLGGTEICPGSSGRGQISCTLNFYKSLASLTLTNLLPP